MDQPPQDLVRAGSVADTSAAHVITARLSASGIAAHVVSRTAGEFPLSVGNLAEVDIWVQPADLEDTRAVLRAHEGTSVTDSTNGDTDTDATVRALAVVTLVVLALSVGWFLMRIF